MKGEDEGCYFVIHKRRFHIKKLIYAIYRYTSRGKGHQTAITPIYGQEHQWNRDSVFMGVSSTWGVKNFHVRHFHTDRWLMLDQLGRGLGSRSGSGQNVQFPHHTFINREHAFQENCTLLTEINNLRTELKSTRTRCFQMESILGLSARFLPPSVARAKLKHVTEDRDKLDDKFKQKIEVSATSATFMVPTYRYAKQKCKIFLTISLNI